MFTIWFRLHGDNPADLMRVDVDFGGLAQARLVWDKLAVSFFMKSARP